MPGCPEEKLGVCCGENAESKGSRVVWGLWLVIAIFWPSRRLKSVDLPTFGRPITATKPL